MVPTDIFTFQPLDLGVDAEHITRQLTSVYLVEPRRASSAVLKFSGTLGMRNGQDKRSATIMAFSHFVLEDSACRYMFADIQGDSVLLREPCLFIDCYYIAGSMDRNPFMQNESVLMLFDPMTHTPRGYVTF